MGSIGKGYKLKNIIIESIADIETNIQDIISEFLDPIFLPKKPEMKEANKGRKIIK